MGDIVAAGANDNLRLGDRRAELFRSLSRDMRDCANSRGCFGCLSGNELFTPVDPLFGDPKQVLVAGESDFGTGDIFLPNELGIPHFDRSFAEILAELFFLPLELNDCLCFSDLVFDEAATDGIETRNAGLGRGNLVKVGFECREALDTHAVCFF